MKIPSEMLDEYTLKALVEEFVTRDGTDLVDAEKKIDQILALLKKGEVFISYDEEEETTTIVAT